MNNFKITDYDIIYLSYDEPNAEKNYADLCSKIPWAKRIHGVEGSDAAHKACANLSETDRFITVDGDNIVRQEFLNQHINFDKDEDLSNCVISWAGNNVVNGLVYGNGGIKCWPKEFVLNMRTHENADPDNAHAQVDFCWDVRYLQMEGVFSDVHNNATAQQAWRAGFREGVKMALDRGLRVDLDGFHKNHWKNLHRLYIWLMAGADAENGMWAIYGAREGLYKTMCTGWDFVNVRDFQYLNNYWEEVKETVGDDLEDNISKLGGKLINDLGIPIAKVPLSAEQSKFFKTVYQNPERMTNKLLEKE
tara:strand:+ start:1316 stop:2233 length:918 start_codon:yes stop_codon:yes gene_type:complete